MQTAGGSIIGDPQSIHYSVKLRLPSGIVPNSTGDNKNEPRVRYLQLLYSGLTVTRTVLMPFGLSFGDSG